jgi:hypothetical protein
MVKPKHMLPQGDRGPVKFTVIAKPLTLALENAVGDAALRLVTDSFVKGATGVPSEAVTFPEP